MIISIIALYLFIFGGATGIATLFNGLDKKDVNSALDDSVRSASILDLSEQLDGDLGDNEKLWDAQRDNVVTVLKDYRALPADFQAQAQHAERLLSERHQMVLRTRAAMKKLMSEDEWNVVFAGR